MNKIRPLTISIMVAIAGAFVLFAILGLGVFRDWIALTFLCLDVCGALIAAGRILWLLHPKDTSGDATK